MSTNVILGALIAFSILLGATSTPEGAEVFKTPEHGVDALISALRSNDRVALSRIFGPGHERLLGSGDPVADKNRGEQFVRDFEKKHALEVGDQEATLDVGLTDWPMPIPLVRAGGGWAFDAGRGEDEIIARRIGANELAQIQVCRAAVDAQLEYASIDRNGDGVLEYADRFIASPGKHDGLYWPNAPGEPPSPLGPAVGRARAEGYQVQRSEPYHGYFYRMLGAQGDHAAGGARNYRERGRLIGGVAIVAYPARYGESGLTTFICNQGGLVYEKELGPDTRKIAEAMSLFDPDPSWQLEPR